MATSRENFIEDLRKAKYTVHASIREIQAIKVKLEKHERDVKISKTAGAAGSIAGTVLLFTPAFFVGGAILAAGAITSIGAEIGDSIVTGSEGKNIFEIMESIQDQNDEIANHLENIDELADQLEKEENLSKEDAYYHAWYWYVKKGIKGCKKGKKFVVESKKAVQFIRANSAGRAAMRANALKGVPLTIEKFVGKTVGKVAGKTAGVMAEKSAKRATTAFKGLSKVIGKKTLGIFSIAFDASDIVSTWQQSNPSVAKADEALQLFSSLEDEYEEKIKILSETADDDYGFPVGVNFIIENPTTEKVVEIADSRSGRIIAAYLRYSNNQKWQFDPDSNTIKNVQYPYVLDICGSDGKNVIAWPQHGGSNQVWKYDDTHCHIINPATKKVLDISGGDGRSIIVWPLHGGANQKWRIIQVS